MTKKELVKGLKLLKTAEFINSKELTEEQTALWFDMLKDLDNESFIVAIRKIIMTSKFFPTIAEIREKATEKEYVSADKAWLEVLNQKNLCAGTLHDPVYSNSVIEEAVRSIGGLDRIWKAGVDQESYYRHGFITAYNGMIKENNEKEKLGYFTRIEAKQILDKTGIEIKGVGD